MVAELDPTRPYAEGSPCSPGHALSDVHPNDPDHGTHHEWEVWNRVDHSAYRDAVPRFCSEFGFQGPPTWATLQRAVRDADGAVATKDHPTFLLHQKADDGNAKLDRGLEPHLGVPDDFTDWHWATQLNQARAVTHALTHYRSWWPRTAGAIVWQLNDCWPVTSWAAVDGDGRVKPLWWALRAAFADRLLTVQHRPGPTGDEVVVAIVNDTDEPWAGTLFVRRERLEGTPLASDAVDVAVAPRSVHLARAGGRRAGAAATRHPRRWSSSSVASARCTPGSRTSTSPSTRRRSTWPWPPSPVATGSTSRRAASRRTSPSSSTGSTRMPSSTTRS